MLLCTGAFSQPLVNPSLSLPHRVQSWKQADRATATINILLVIAKNISPKPTAYNDVSPFLASSALTEVQRHLEESGAALQLHVEIARPGTLASFKSHLQRSEDIHRQGYFHIVHCVPAWNSPHLERENPEIRLSPLL